MKKVVNSHHIAKDWSWQSMCLRAFVHSEMLDLHIYLPLTHHSDPVFAVWPDFVLAPFTSPFRAQHHSSRKRFFFYMFTMGLDFNTYSYYCTADQRRGDWAVNKSSAKSHPPICWEKHPNFTKCLRAVNILTFCWFWFKETLVSEPQICLFTDFGLLAWQTCSFNCHLIYIKCTIKDSGFASWFGFEVQNKLYCVCDPWV